jgi:hypothetical protein
MVSNSTTEYKIIADKIVSPDEDIIVEIVGGVYKGSITEENRYATMSDIGASAPIAYTPVWSGTGLVQSSNLATGTYFDYGQMVVVQITVPMTNVTNFGAGYYTVTLPKESALHANGWGGTLHDTSTGRLYTLKGHLEADSNICSLFFINSSSQDQVFNATAPFILDTTDLFHINFIYQAKVS